jgi:hypothetical protein
MHRFRPAAACNFQNSINIQIRFGGRGGTDAVGLISSEDVERSAIHVRVNRSRSDAQFPAGAGQAYCYLSAVRNQDLPKHRKCQSLGKK